MMLLHPARLRSFDFVRMTHDTTAAAVLAPGATEYYTTQSAAVVRRQHVVPAAIVPIDLVCIG